METLIAVSQGLRVRTGPRAGRFFRFEGALRLGRHPHNELSIADLHASRYHCWITSVEGRAILEDLGSANGTYVNGERIRGRLALNRGDLVRMGTTEFTFTEIQE